MFMMHVDYVSHFIAKILSFQCRSYYVNFTVFPDYFFHFNTCNVYYILRCVAMKYAALYAIAVP